MRTAKRRTGRRPSAKVRAVREVGLGKLDPSRTLMLRRAFVREMERRFARVKARIVKLVVDEDALGLKDRQPAFNSSDYFSRCERDEDGRCLPEGGSPGGKAVQRQGLTVYKVKGVPWPVDAQGQPADVLMSKAEVKKLQAAGYVKDRLGRWVKEGQERLPKQQHLARADLPTFSAEVRRAASSLGAEARPFGNPVAEKVYISKAWEAIKDQGLNLEEFKDRLAQAHRQGLVQLTRSDIPDDLALRDASEIRYGSPEDITTTWHYLTAPNPTANANDFFARCDRDEGGRCLPEGGLSAEDKQALTDFQYIKERKGLFWVDKPREPYVALQESDKFASLIDRLPQSSGTLHRGTMTHADELPKEGTLTANEATTNAGSWAFQSDPRKVQLFLRWLKEVMGQEVMDGADDDSDDAWWQEYVRQGYAKGAGRSFDEWRRKRPEAARELMDFTRGTREQFMRQAFGQPESIEKVKLLAGRSFHDLEGITKSMSTRISRVLTDGLVQGQHPHQIAKSMVDQVDIDLPRARALARTEIIRAHAEGQLHALEALGVEEVGVAVEWATADDPHVCPECEPMEGVVLKIEEAYGMIPRHPNCRCAFVPANVDEDQSEQKRSFRDVTGAIVKSVKAEGIDPDDEDGMASAWGPATTIDRSRPRGIFNRLQEGTDDEEYDFHRQE